MLRTLTDRARDVHGHGTAIDPEGRWRRTDQSLRYERWVGAGETYADDEVVLQPVGIGRQWIVTTRSIDGERRVIRGPVAYDAAKAAAERYMTGVAQSRPLRETQPTLAAD